jgi:hypothetical protein
MAVRFLSSETIDGNVKIADEKILALRTSSNDYAIQYRDLDFRFIGSADSSTQRKFSFGYYTSDNPAGTWNGQVYINSYTGFSRNWNYFTCLSIRSSIRWCWNSFKSRNIFCFY